VSLITKMIMSMASTPWLLHHECTIQKQGSIEVPHGNIDMIVGRKYDGETVSIPINRCMLVLILSVMAIFIDMVDGVAVVVFNSDNMYRLYDEGELTCTMGHSNRVLR